jgi:glyoxylase-like metal-dependent hydrolase (beta-lactamase superfamily II)
MAAMRRSIARLASLPDETRVCPGHGPETTIARERRVNPFFPRA